MQNKDNDPDSNKCGDILPVYIVNNWHLEKLNKLAQEDIFSKNNHSKLPCATLAHPIWLLKRLKTEVSYVFLFGEK